MRRLLPSALKNAEGSFFWAPGMLNGAPLFEVPVSGCRQSPEVQSISVHILSITNAEHLLTCTFSLKKCDSQVLKESPKKLP